jgi:hypothetical protein
LIHTVNLPERHNPVDHQTPLTFQRSSSNPMERLRGPEQTVSSLLELCLERDRSLLGNERVTEKNEEMGIVMKTTVSLYIMDAHITESSYILAGPYRIQNSLNGFAA